MQSKKDLEMLEKIRRRHYPFSFSLSPETIQWIDRRRGAVSRSKFLKQILEREMEREMGREKKGGSQ